MDSAWMYACLHGWKWMEMNGCCVDGTSMYCRYGVNRLDACTNKCPACTRSWTHPCMMPGPYGETVTICVATRLTPLQCRVAGQQLRRQRSSTANLLHKQTWKPRLQSSWPQPNSNRQQMRSRVSVAWWILNPYGHLSQINLWSNRCICLDSVFWSPRIAEGGAHSAVSSFLTADRYCKMLKKHPKTGGKWWKQISPFSPQVFSSKQRKAEASGELTNLQRAFQFWDIDSAYVPSHC